MKITPEHIALFKIATQKSSTESLITKALRLKAEFKTHAQIAEALNISASYVNHIIVQTRKAANLAN